MRGVATLAALALFLSLGASALAAENPAQPPNPVAAGDPSSAEDLTETSDIRVTLNEEPLYFKHPLYLDNSRLLVPADGFFAPMGVKLYWDPLSRTGRFFDGDGDVFTFRAGRTEMAVSSNVVELSRPPLVKDDILYIPVRDFSEQLGAGVAWVDETRTVQLTLEGAPGQKPEESVLARYSEEEIELLTWLINSEAHGEPLIGKVAVGAVVMNRVKSPDFPNSIREVIYQPGQFAVITQGLIYRLPLEPDSREAALRALAGEDPSQGALFFFDPSRSKSEFLWNRPMTVVIGGHRFAR